MARIRECLKCGRLFEGRGSYCPRHPFGVFAQRPRSKVYGTTRWKKLSRELVAEHVARNGWVCPGDGPEHPAHPSTRLSVDHIERLTLVLARGGDPFDRANLRVLCALRNAQRGLARAST